MKKLLLWLLLMPAAAYAAPAEVQSMDEHQLAAALIVSALQSERKAVIAGDLELSDEEQQAFWPVYHAYRMEADVLKQRLLELAGDYVEQHAAGSLNEAGARRLLDESLSLQQRLVQLKRKYIKAFGKALPAKKVTRFYQLDERLDNFEMLKMARSIPLMATQ